MNKTVSPPKKSNPREDIDAQLRKLAEHEYEANRIRQDMASIILGIGSVEEAIALGLVRLTFAAPRGFYKMIRQSYFRRNDY